MNVQLHHKLALLGAACTSAMALSDAVTHGVTGNYSVLADTSGNAPVQALGDLVHGLTYLALSLVLVREAGRFAAVNRVARACRWVVLVSLVTLAPGFTLVAPVLAITGIDAGAPHAIWGGIAGIAFIGMILGSLVLGLALLPSRALGVGARVLALMLPVAGLTALVAGLASGWAHPGYLETTLYFGLATLGLGTAADAVSALRHTTLQTRGHSSADGVRDDCHKVGERLS